MFRARIQDAKSLAARGLLPTLSAAIAVTAVSLAPARIAAQPAPPPPISGRILFARAGQLLVQDLAVPGDPSVVAQLPEGAVVKDMEPNRDGSLVAIHLEDQTLWWLDGALATTGCEGRGRPSPAGECLACETAAGTTLVSAANASFMRKLPADLRDVGFKGARADELIARGAEGVVAFSPATPGRRKIVATSGARSHLVIAPDGSRGAAIFGDGDGSRIFSFALDGTGVPRQLGGPGWPVGWSSDSAWVLIQEGLPPEDGGGEGWLGPELTPVEDRWLMAAPSKKKKKKGKKEADTIPRRRLLDERACAAKAVGGEEKCWNGYQAIAFSPDVSRVLIERDGTFYVGAINGVKAERPKKVVEGADPGATWIP